MIEFLASLYRRLIKFGLYLAPVALLILRVGWGWELFESSRGHFHNFDDMVAQFRSWNIPFPKQSVIISSSTELAGGVLLMLGLGARAISIPLFFNFCVAFATASKDNVKNIFSQDLAKIVDDSAYPFLITSLIIIAFGPGILSIDGLLKKTVFKRYAAGL